MDHNNVCSCWVYVIIVPSCQVCHVSFLDIAVIRSLLMHQFFWSLYVAKDLGIVADNWQRILTSYLTFLLLLFPLSSLPDPVTDSIFTFSAVCFTLCTMVLCLAAFFQLNCSRNVSLCYAYLLLMAYFLEGTAVCFSWWLPPMLLMPAGWHEEFQWSMWYAYLSQGSPAVQLTRVIVIYFCGFHSTTVQCMAMWGHPSVGTLPYQILVLHRYRIIHT